VFSGLARILRGWLSVRKIHDGNEALCAWFALAFPVALMQRAGKFAASFRVI
jgi:hypothetical protein